MESVRAIVNISWATLGAVWLLLMFTNKKTQQRDRPGSQILYRAPMLLSYLLAFSPLLWVGVLGHQWIARSSAEQIAGAAMTAAGVLFAIWARLSIGRNWSGVVTVKEEHELIQRGPYAWVRHPIYTGMIVAMIGTALVIDRWASVLAVVILTVSFIFKSRVEEQFMRRTFGEQYDAYCDHTGAFLPHL